MNAKLDFQPPSEDHQQQNTGDADLKQVGDGPANGRQFWPFALAVGASLVWIGAAGFYAWRADLFSSFAKFSLVEIAALITAAISPLVIFWLIALVFQRSDPLLERRLAVSRTMNRALAPIEMAEKRLDQLIARFQHDLDHVDAAVDLASSRIDKLEDRFKSEVADLFSATADAEAKSETIRETLRREREALEEIDSVIADRLEDSTGLLDTFMERFARIADETHGRIQDTANTLYQSAQTLEETGEKAVGHITKAENHLSDRLVSLDSLSETLAERLSKIARELSEQINDLQDRLDRVESTDEKLSAAIEERHNRLAYMAESSKADVEKIESEFSKSSDALHEKIDSALERSKDVESTLAQYGAQFETVVHDAVQKAQDDLKLFEQGVRSLAENAASTTQERMDGTLDQIKGLIDQVEGQLRAFDEKATRTGIEVTEEISRLNVSFDNQAQGLTLRAKESVEELERLAQKLTDQTNIVSATASEAAQNMGAAGAHMDEQTANLGQLLDDVRRRIETVASVLSDEREAIKQASESSANTVLEAADRFRTQSSELSSITEDTSARIHASASQLDGALSGLEERGSEAAQLLEAAVRSLKSEAGGLMQTLEKSSEALGQASGAFGGERERILKETAQAAERLQGTADMLSEKYESMRRAGSETGFHLEGVAARFSDAAEKIIEITKSAENQAGKSGEAFEKAINEAMAKGVREVGQSMDALNQMFGAEMSALEEKVARSIDQTLNSLRAAASEAGAEGEKMAALLTDQSDRLVSRANSFLTKSEEIERRILATSKDEFVRTSSLLIESLQSAAVDIDKILETEVPDDVWQKYLSGDRSIFSRRAVRLGDRGVRSKVKEAFDTDREFRDTVLKFFRDFEGLMEQVATRDSHSILSVTLISSEMGKLYVLLAQSLKKIQ